MHTWTDRPTRPPVKNPWRRRCDSTPFYLQIKTTGVQIKTTGIQIKTQDFKLQHTVLNRNYEGQIETQLLKFKATKQFSFDMPIRLCE